LDKDPETAELGIAEKEKIDSQGLKEFIRRNAWRVFQVLIEQVCQAEYQMITQSLERENLKKVQDL